MSSSVPVKVDWVDSVVPPMAILWVSVAVGMSDSHQEWLIELVETVARAAARSAMEVESISALSSAYSGD